MKSPIVMDLEPLESCYSDLMVLKSAAGYYIGTTYTHDENSPTPGLVEPGSRDSFEYYATEAEAQHALETKSWTQRPHP